MLVSNTRVAVPLVFVLKLNFLFVRSPRVLPEIAFPENHCTKAEFANLKLQEKRLFDLCVSFKGFGSLN